MSSLPWFRLYTDVLTDRKIKKVAKITRRPLWEVVGFWTFILATAADCPERGVLADSDGDPISDEELIDDMGIEVTMYHLLMDALKQKSLILQDGNGTYYLPNWEKRQFKSDSAAERMRRYRERKREEVTVTSPLRNGDGLDTDTDTDTEDTGGDTPPPTKIFSDVSRYVFERLNKDRKAKNQRSLDRWGTIDQRDQTEQALQEIISQKGKKEVVAAVDWAMRNERNSRSAMCNTLIAWAKNIDKDKRGPNAEAALAQLKEEGFEL